MISFRRLLAVGAVLSATVVLTYTNVRGEPGRDAKDKIKDKENKEFRESGTNPGLDRPARNFAEDLARSRFDDQPLIVYQTLAGDTLFAAQVKPNLEAVPAQPRDIALLIDTSASKAQGPLANAIAIAKALAGKLKPEDRVAIFLVNTRVHNITKGFKSPANLDEAWKTLAQEYPSGAANLKQAITDATASFQQEGRQRVIVLLGDGNSIANPILANDRVALSSEMVRHEVSFFSVPLGNHLEPLNLHGLPNSTGGKVVRTEPRETVETFVPRFLEALAVPVLYPAKVNLPAEVIESFPTRLPPLRSDVPTLLVGKIKAGLAQFEYTITGRIAGKEVTVRTSEKVPTADTENYFLMGMVGQWKEQKDRPALMQANRALAFACDQNQMARLKLLTDAEFALDENKFDPALRLLHQALDLDPECKQAKIGIDLVQQMRDGKVTRKELIEKFRPRGDDLLIRDDGVKILREDADPAPAAKAGPAAPAPGNRDVLADIKARQAVADQQAVQAINESLTRANRLVETQPDDAMDLLKTTLDSIQRNPDVSERVRQTQADRIEKALASNARRGATVKRAIAEGLAARAAADARVQRERIERGGDDRIRVRMAEFHNLMNKAREDLAYQVAQDIREDLVNNGKPVPPSVTAAYQIGLSGYNLRELRDLRRQREERWLAVTLSVERSHIPFSDEPGVEFPSAAKIKLITNYNSGRGFDNWRDWSLDRIKRYSTADFGPAMPEAAYKLRDLLGTTVNYAGLNDPKATLDDALQQLKRRYDFNYEINTRAFAIEGLKEPDQALVAETKPIDKMDRVTLATVLKRILARVPSTSGATYMIRRDTLEITTNQFQAAEKTLRVYPVADLVIPIPSPQQFNQQQFVNQGGVQGFGGQPGAGGFGGLNGFNQGGGLGALGAGGLGLGALGAGGLGLGALGAGGLGALGALGAGGLGALGALGAGGLGALGAGGLGALGALGAGGLGALGAAGALGALGAGGLGAAGALGALGGGLGGLQGVAGIGGGVAGQNGGGFGLNSNDSRQLINLIRQVVGKPSDWAPNYNPYTGLPINPLDDTDNGNPLKDEGGQLGYYDPANALIVKGSSRITSRATSPVNVGGATAPGMGFLDGRQRDLVAHNGDNKPEVKTNLDPKEMWQDALKQGVEKPGVIIAVADFLALNKKFDHAAEFLKANLRQGIVVRPWVYESLAVALRETHADPEEIERAEVAAADLEPGDARSFLRAAEAMKANKNYGQAVAFARQASLLEPNAPYAYDSGLVYAELAQDPKAMEWAAGNLVGKDWPARDMELKAKALQKLDALASILAATDKPTAQKLRQAVTEQRQRDLVVKLSWTGEADIDLKIKEPSGSTCSPLNRQTVGGGILVGDPLTALASEGVEAHAESYLAAQAFTGTYQVTVHRVWGKPLGNKAQLTIIRHQGTPEETQQLVTVDLAKVAAPIQVKLEGGRRTETAYVPPPSRQDSSTVTADAGPSTDKVLMQLRNLADPEMTGTVRKMSGTAYGAGATATPSRSAPPATEAAAGDRMLYQTRVSSFMKNSVDVTAQAVLAADCRSVRVSVTPVFDTNVSAARPTVNNPVIPGGQ